MTDIVHTFAGNPLDRGDALRRDPDWLAAAARHPDSGYLPMWRLNVLIEDGEEGGGRHGDTHGLGWLPPARIAGLEVGTPPVFLGLAGDQPRFSTNSSGNRTRTACSCPRNQTGCSLGSATTARTPPGR